MKKLPLTYQKAFIGLIFVLLTLGVVAQKAIPPKPYQLVNDYVGALSGPEKRALEQKLVAYNDSTSTQIAVVIDNSLEGEDAFDYTVRLARAWGIGQGETDNGILIYIALADRQLRIQTGYGAEGFLPDALARRIIDQIIAPAFRQQQYYTGLDRATDAIIQLAAGEYTADDLERGGDDSAFPLFFVFLIIFLIFFLANRGGGDDDDDGGYYRGGRYNRGRGGGWVILPGGGGGGSWTGGGGGFGGGGFGGFGGGGFGGGGAGGSW